MRSSVIEKLMVRGSQVALKHVIHDMETRTLVMELRRRAIKRWVPCGDMDCRLKIPHSAKAECGFRTTPEECLYDSGPIGPSIQYNTIFVVYCLRSLQRLNEEFGTCDWCHLRSGILKHTHFNSITCSLHTNQHGLLFYNQWNELVSWTPSLRENASSHWVANHPWSSDH